MKMIHHNLTEKQREVFLLSLFEDQIYKWENCLDPSDDIKYFDRTFKLIKNRLLKATTQKRSVSNLNPDESQDISQPLS